MRLNQTAIEKFYCVFARLEFDVMASCYAFDGKLAAANLKKIMALRKARL